MSLVERAQDIRARLMKPVNGVDDPGIDLRRHKAHTRNTMVEMRDVIAGICKFYEIDRALLIGQRREAYIVKPRQIAMFLGYTMTKMSLKQMGAALGGRDHTTVLHGIRKIEELEKTDEAWAIELNSVRRRLRRPRNFNWSEACFDRWEI